MATVNWVIVGDSITRRAAEDIERHMIYNFGDGLIDAVGGRQAYDTGPNTDRTSAEAMADAAAALAGEGVLVMEEDGRFVTQQDYRRFVKETVDVLTLTGGKTRLVWVMPSDRGTQAQQDRAAAHRRSIRAEIAAYPNHGMAAWNREVTEHPEYTPDGRHPDCATGACRALSWLILRAALND